MTSPDVRTPVATADTAQADRARPSVSSHIADLIDEHAEAYALYHEAGTRTMRERERKLAAIRADLDSAIAAKDNRIAALKVELARGSRVEVPEELRRLSEAACEGEWEALPFLYDDGDLGPDYFICGGGGNLGGDFDEADAKLAAASVNLVRNLLQPSTDPAEPK